MLTIFPLSCYPELRFQLDRNYVIGISNGVAYPVDISFQVETGKRWFNGGHDCFHRQVHGYAVDASVPNATVTNFIPDTSVYGPRLMSFGGSLHLIFPERAGVNSFDYLQCPDASVSGYQVGQSPSYEGVDADGYPLYVYQTTDCWYAEYDSQKYICSARTLCRVVHALGNKGEPWIVDCSYDFDAVIDVPRTTWATHLKLKDFHPTLEVAYGEAFSLPVTWYQNTRKFSIYDAKLVACSLMEQLRQAELVRSGSGYQIIRFGNPELLGAYQIRKWISDLRADMARTRPQTRFLTQYIGESTQQAADAIRSFDGNLGTLLLELRELRNTISGLVDLIHGEVNVRNLSSLWLNLRYGIRLTLQDSSELVKSISEEVQRVQGLYTSARGTHIEDGYTVHCKLFCDLENANAFAKVFQFLQKWDLFPSLRNVWDVIPYSFVVDWLVDIEGFLSDIDTRTWTSTLNIFLVCYSYKYEWSSNASRVDYRLVGSLKYSEYKRWYDTSPVQPTPHFSGGSFSAKNVVDGASLIIQRF